MRKKLKSHDEDAINEGKEANEDDDAQYQQQLARRLEQQTSMKTMTPTELTLTKRGQQ